MIVPIQTCSKVPQSREYYIFTCIMVEYSSDTHASGKLPSRGVVTHPWEGLRNAPLWN